MKDIMYDPAEQPEREPSNTARHWDLGRGLDPYEDMFYYKLSAEKAPGKKWDLARGLDSYEDMFYYKEFFRK